MDKSDLIKLLVVIIALIFVLSMFGYFTHVVPSEWDSSRAGKHNASVSALEAVI